MPTLSQILKREFITNGKSKSLAAAELNVTEIENYINGNRYPKPPALVKLSNLLGFSLSELTENAEQNVPRATKSEDPGTLSTASKPEATSYQEVRKGLKNGLAKKKTIPFYDAEAVGGITETDMTPIHAPSGTIDIGDLLNDSQAAIRIYGNSMLPNYPPGCVVGLVRCNKSFIEPGEVYVIETRDRRLLKRLFYKEDNTDGDLITCYSDNIMKFEGGSRNGKLAYPPFDLPKGEIINLFMVTGVIKRNANSVIINR